MRVEAETPVKAAIYARVSTEDQAERETVKAQLTFLRRFCDLHEIPVAGEYVDDGISGATALDVRPEGRRLLDDARAGCFGVVLCYRLDRLGRSLSALLAAHDALDGAGIAIRSATEPFDTSTSIGRFVFQLLGSIAELEKATLQDRMTGGRDRVAAEGRYTGGQVPVGYTLDAAKCLTPSDRPVPELAMSEAEMVRDLFTRIAGGSSAMAESRRLSSMDVRPRLRYGAESKPSPQAGWLPGTITRIIRNPVYKGTSVLESRRGTIERAVTPLVDEATWDAAGAALLRNRKLSKKNAKNEYLLRGLIRCGNCGAGYSGRTVTDGKREHEYPFYHCNGGKGVTNPLPQDRCRAKYVPTHKLDEIVWSGCRGFIERPGEALADAQAQLRARLEQTAGLEQRRRHAAAQLAEKDRERERVLTLYRRGKTTLSEAESELDAIARETAALREEIEALRAQEALASAQEAQLTDVSMTLMQLRGQLAEIEATGDTAAKRRIVGSLVNRIVLTTDGEGRGRRVKATVRYAFKPSQVVALENPTASVRRSEGCIPGSSWG